MSCDGGDILTAIRLLTILGGVATAYVVLRYDMRDIEGGALLAAIVANTAVVVYIMLYGDNEVVRIVQDVTILLIYFVVARSMIRAHRRRTNVQR